MFELFQLRCFVAVAEELHFGRAAARLFMTQPPLSRQVQLLEQALGVQLLERTSRSVSLTSAGEAFYADAKTILKQAEHAGALARRIAGGEVGKVTMGFTAVAGYELIPQLISSARRGLPDIDFVLKEMVSGSQIAALKTNSIDIGLIRPVVAGHSLDQILFATEPLVLALPAHHALADKTRIRPADLEQQPVIMYAPDEGKYFYDLVTGLFSASGVHARYVQHIGQTHTILALVGAGLGMAVVPESAMCLGLRNIVFRPLWRQDVMAEIYLTWRADNRNPALQAVRTFALAHRLPKHSCKV